MRARGVVSSLLAALLLVGCVSAPRRPAPPQGACADCFWDHQPVSLRGELVEHYEQIVIADPLLDAERELLLGRLTEDPRRVCRARERFAAIAARERVGERRALAAESAALLAEECGALAAPAFRDAARAAEALGETWRARLYASAADERLELHRAPPPPEPRLVAPPDAEAVVVGESRIDVDVETRIGSQLERVLRDWLSAQLAHDGVSAPRGSQGIVDWHEGHQLKKLIDHTSSSLVPLGRGLAAREGERWYGADEAGSFRFEILQDKTQYPTTRHGAGLALLADTHGFSALVSSALAANVDMAVACGDSEGKMHAALHLASKGVDAYFPCDRFVGLILGYEGPGTLIGSAPIRLEAGGRATIGDRPITIWRDEKAVVEDAPGVGEVRYCDAPRRYFERLAKAFPLELDVVAVERVGQASRVVQRAFETGARLIGVRVANEEDARPVLDWLAASSRNRALLFHSAAYPAGRRVFETFPTRTSFGDPRPRFVSARDGS